MALSLMSSGSRWRNGGEILCTALLLIGLYVMIVLSNMIEEEIHNLESLRSTDRKTDLDMSNMSTEMNL